MLHRERTKESAAKTTLSDRMGVTSRKVIGAMREIFGGLNLALIGCPTLALHLAMVVQDSVFLGFD